MEKFDILWEKFHRRIFSVCLDYVGPDDAHDVCAQVWDACRHKLLSEYSELECYSYIKKTAIRKSLRWIDRKQRIEKAETEFVRRSDLDPLSMRPFDGGSPENKIESLFMSGILTDLEENILKGLMEGLTQKEMSGALGVSLSTIKRHTITAFAKGREFLKAQNN